MNTEPRISAWQSSHAEASLVMEYTNSLAPREMWHFRLRLPDGGTAEFDVKILPRDVPIQVEALSRELANVEKVVGQLDRLSR